MPEPWQNSLPLCLMLGALQIAKLTEEVAACKEHARKLQEHVRQPPSMLRHTLVLRAPRCMIAPSRVELLAHMC